MPLTRISATEASSSRATQSMLRALFDVVGVVSRERNLVEGLASWQAFTGRTVDAGHWLDAVHPDDRSLLELGMVEAPERVAVYEVLVRIERQAGQWMCCRVHIAPEIEDDGRVRGWLLCAGRCEAAEVDEAAASRLARLQRLLEAIVEHTAAAVYVKDIEGRYTLVNRSAAEVFELAPEAVLFRRADELFSTEIAAALTAHDRAVLTSREPLVVEERAGRPHRERVFLSVKVPLLDERGRAYAVCGISTDITERKATEDELSRKSAELAEAHRRKDEFLNVLAHELRNPLAPVQYAVELLRDDPDTRLQERALSIIERNVHHFVRLVDDLLDVARLTRGRIGLQLEELDLLEVMAEVLDDATSLFEAKQQVVHPQLPSGPVRVSGDRARIKQVFWNVIENASKYSPHRSPIEVSIEPGSDEHRVSVVDHGRGIPAELLTDIFDAFTQAKSPYQGGSGLGLGLHLVRAMTELHGGRVEAQSPGPGAGSTFAVWLPALR